ncbi:HsdM-like protein [Advenella incenata]|uniref:HsdM-like protein n=1 Tax=Advenella incenata TaxID=267800 RepID=A0A4Q7VPE6_9BURK|nr:HsdM-like protein [Advenella incenata]
MTELDKKQLGTTLWGIADQQRGAMNADDFRDYMLSFLFLRYLSDNYEVAAHKELGSDYPTLDTGVLNRTVFGWFMPADSFDEIQHESFSALCHHRYR